MSESDTHNNNNNNNNEGDFFRTTFDHIYLLNLPSREDRLQTAVSRLQQRGFVLDQDYTVWDGCDGQVLSFLHSLLVRSGNHHFSNSSYVGCAIAHLSIYNHAVKKGYSQILILEDDNRLIQDIKGKMKKVCLENPCLFSPSFPPTSPLTTSPPWDLLYLGFIPLSSDCTQWTYRHLPPFSRDNGPPFLLRGIQNAWGLFAYGISATLMKELLQTYRDHFPMELDRYFVTQIQPRGRCFAIIPQMFVADDDVFSDNSQRCETGMIQRSHDSRFASAQDYF